MNSKSNEENTEIDISIESSEEMEPLLEKKMEEIYSIATDARVIWAIQRFFFFSLFLTVLKILIYSVTGYYLSIRSIAIDAFLDVLVSGLSIYLIQMQRKVFSKVNRGQQSIKVDAKGVVGIASIQGTIFFIGGLVIFFQNIYMWVVRTSFEDEFSGFAQTYEILPGLIISTILSIKFIMYIYHKLDRKETNNIALKSLETNLLMDIYVNGFAWFILMSVSFTDWFWKYLDPIIAIVISIWMIIEGVRYIKPYVEIHVQKVVGEEEEEENEKEKKGKEEKIIEND